MISPEQFDNPLQLDFLWYRFDFGPVQIYTCSIENSCFPFWDAIVSIAGVSNKIIARIDFITIDFINLKHKCIENYRIKEE